MHSQHTVTPPPLWGGGRLHVWLKTPKWRILCLEFKKFKLTEYFNFIKWEIELEIAIALLIYISLNDLHF